MWCLVMEYYLGSLAEFEEQFATETTCLEYLARLRWPDGFVCPVPENELKVDTPLEENFDDLEL